MSILKVGAIRGVSASSDAITVASDGTCTANITSLNSGQFSNRNKVINGAMVISERYGTTAYTSPDTNKNYTIDRWAYWSNQASKASVQQVTDAPVGFYNSAKCTVVSTHTAASGDWFGYTHEMEGQDIYDLAQGTANAKSFTLSFYVKSSVTGTWAGAIRSKASSPGRSYPFNYTISSANTWERKTITIPGSTDGTWSAGNSVGMNIWFDLGSGSGFHQTVNQWYGGNATGPSASPFIANAGATWFVTGVQLEKGSVATDFEHKSFAQDLALCQRYFYAVKEDTFAFHYRPDYRMTQVQFPQQMRATPTVSATYEPTTGWSSYQPNNTQVTLFRLQGEDQSNTYVRALKLDSEL